VLEDEGDDDGRNCSPEFFSRTVVSGHRRIRRPGAQKNMRLCPGGARGEGVFTSTDEEAREGRGSPEMSPELVWSCGWASFYAGGLAAMWI
jgi:hypothetical protein